MQGKLEALLAASDTPIHERRAAVVGLVLWYGVAQNWAAVHRLMIEHSAILVSEAPQTAALYLVWSEAVLEQPHPDVELCGVTQWLDQYRPSWPSRWLVRANQALAASSGEREATWGLVLNSLYREAGLSEVTVLTGEGSLFDRLVGGGRSQSRLQRTIACLWMPKVTVVVPLYNAGHRIEAVLRSLNEQTWPNLEVIVVNDASADASPQLAEAACSRMQAPGRVWRLVHTSQNQGAYAARNTGAAQATGAFITVHDADDWSHPEKIKCQVRALRRQPKAVASVSHWVRMSESGQFTRGGVEAEWVHRNVSSVMVRASVLKTLGYWDDVKVNADTEYYYRIQSAYGEGSIVEVQPGVPLALGRHDPASLSQQSATHVSTQFLGVRKNYMDAAHRWHRKAVSKKGLYLSAQPEQRPFQAPGVMCRKALPVANPDERDAVQQSLWWDPVWYIAAHADLHDQPVDAFEHWWKAGAEEGRDPSPGFSVSGYAALYADELNGQNPLTHYIEKGEALGYEPCPRFEGECAEHPERPWVLVCAHQAGKELYGAERSLLDVLAGFQALRVNTFVVVPSTVNADYIQSVLAHCQKVNIMPLPWWRQGRAAWPQVESGISRLIAEHSFSLVYLNTLVHYEAAMAARAAGVPVAVHVRELPEQDPDLCRFLGATPEQVFGHVTAIADRVVANSRFVASQYSGCPVSVVPNCVNPEPFRELALPRQARLVVGMVSSNLPKKGLADFVALARQLEASQVPVKCRLIGPVNEHVQVLQGEDLPSNFVVAGYARDAQTALASVDILVNLSHFQESFGRTLIEAMAAARPVIAYDWGALSEVVVHGETGYLVQKGDVEAVARHVKELTEYPDRLLALGRAGQQRVEQFYTLQVMAERLADALGISE